MLRIQIVSDLHIEHRRDMQRLKWYKGGIDVLIVAGDACDTPSMPRFNHMLQPILRDGVKVIYVPGNHETYRADTVEDYEKALHDVFAGREGEGLHLLQNSSMTLVDPSNEDARYRVIGSTLWSDLSNPMDAMEVAHWPDFYLEGHDTDRHTALHKKAVRFIEDELFLAHEGNEDAIVVTHFVPCGLSVKERYRGNPANPYFVTELSHLMMESDAPMIWIHGHTHDLFDYEFSNTRVICNPYGYPNEQQNYDQSFDPQKIIQI